MAGVFAFNPIFAQKGVPVRIRSVLVMVMTLAVAPTVEVPPNIDTNMLDFIIVFIKEIFIGFLFSYVVNVYYYILLGVGEILDTQFGLSMAKVFDPNTSIQMAISDKILNMFFILYIFATNSHLLFIKIVYSSYDVIPLGVNNFNLDSVTGFAIDLFVNCFSLAMKLAFPYVAAQLILEVGLGILMKLIPQIHVFVINMQLKLLLTILLLIVFAQPMSNFIDNYIVSMFNDLQNSLHVVAGG
jgi:flagellar biosynthetic protein FliR